MNEIVRRSVRLPDGHEIVYFEQPCTRGCDVVIAGATEEQVRHFMKGHRNLSSCIERSHRATNNVITNSGRARAKVKEAAAVVPSPPEPKTRSRKKPTKPAIGWDGTVLG